jgi:hypothetical protein
MSKDRKRNWRYKNRYGISFFEYYTLWSFQGGECAICPRTAPVVGKGALYVDHDHKTGQVRGLLCPRCNDGVGFVEAGLSEEAKRYLG